MNWETILQSVWGLLNSPVGIAAIAGIVLWLLNRVYASKPTWQKYEGAIISAIKYAEKQIPDDVANKSLARLDAALRYVLRVYQEANKRSASAKEIAALKDGISVVHNRLEAAGMSLATLKEKGLVKVPKPAVFYEEGVQPQFFTPSGKIEFYSVQLS